MHVRPALGLPSWPPLASSCASWPRWRRWGRPVCCCAAADASLWAIGTSCPRTSACRCMHVRPALSPRR
eukprot:8602508-Pyramimonas_sp.AAC.1